MADQIHDGQQGQSYPRISKKLLLFSKRLLTTGDNIVGITLMRQQIFGWKWEARKSSLEKRGTNHAICQANAKNANVRQISFHSPKHQSQPNRSQLPRHSKHSALSNQNDSHVRTSLLKHCLYRASFSSLRDQSSLTTSCLDLPAVVLHSTF